MTDRSRGIGFSLRALGRGVCVSSFAPAASALLAGTVLAGGCATHRLAGRGDESHDRMSHALVAQDTCRPAAGTVVVLPGGVGPKEIKTREPVYFTVTFDTCCDGSEECDGADTQRETWEFVLGPDKDITINGGNVEAWLIVHEPDDDDAWTKIRSKDRRGNVTERVVPTLLDLKAGYLYVRGPVAINGDTSLGVPREKKTVPVSLPPESLQEAVTSALFASLPAETEQFVANKQTPGPVVAWSTLTALRGLSAVAGSFDTTYTVRLFSEEKKTQVFPAEHRARLEGVLETQSNPKRLDGSARNNVLGTSGDTADTILVYGRSLEDREFLERLNETLSVLLPANPPVP